MGLIEDLIDAIGPENVSDEEFERVAYSRGSSIHPPVVPAVVVLPRSTEDVQSVVRVANRYKTPICEAGGRTGMAGAWYMHGAILLDMTRMNEVVEVDEESLTVTVQAGITYGKLKHELARSGYRIGMIGPHSGLSSTIGAGIAAQAVGFGSARYGHLPETLVGLEVVLPTCEVVRTGTRASVATKTNYSRYAFGADLTGLFVGSLGAFGIITEVSLWLYPLGKAARYAYYYFDTLEAALKSQYRIVKELGTYVPDEILFHAKEPTTGTSAVAPGVVAEAAFGVVLEAPDEGIADAVKKYMDKVVEEEGGKDAGPEIMKDYWTRAMETLPEYTKTLGLQFHPCHQAPIGPSQIKSHFDDHFKFLGEYASELKGLGVNVINFGLVSNHRYVCTPMPFYNPANEANPEKWQRLRELFLEYCEDIIVKSGGANYWSGYQWERNYVKTLGEWHKLLTRIKKLLDPNNILNPGALGLPSY